MQGAQTTTEIFEKTTPALKITNNKLSEISADAWKDMAQYLNTKHTDKIQIKQDPASGVLTFDDPFQQRTVGKPSDSTVMQKPLAHDKPDSTGSHCNNKTDLPKIKIKQDPASGVLTFDDPFQQRNVGKPSDSTVMQKPLPHDKPDSTGSHCNNKTDLPKIKDRPKWIANPSPSDYPVAMPWPLDCNDVGRF